MKLVLMRGTSPGKVFQLEEGSNLIGRWDTDACSFPEIDLEEDDPDVKISRKHALIECKGGSATIEDIGSRNGTFINRTNKLEPGSRYELQPGDEIMVGKIFLRFEAD